MTNKEFADILFPNITKTVEDYEKFIKKKFKRRTSSNKICTKPNGLCTSWFFVFFFIAKKVAEQTGGVFFLRIEDTDQKRSVKNGIVNIIRDLKNFNITFDEGMISETEEIGNYGLIFKVKKRNLSCFCSPSNRKRACIPLFL